MFEKYMICNDGFRNVYENGKMTGFELKVRITYYRGIFASEVERFDVDVDGERFGPESITFSLGDRSFPLEQISKASDVRWQFGEPARLTILKPGGLAPGLHDIRVKETLRISYHAPGMPHRYSKASLRKKMTLVV